MYFKLATVEITMTRKITFRTASTLAVLDLQGLCESKQRPSRHIPVFMKSKWFLAISTAYFQMLTPGERFETVKHEQWRCRTLIMSSSLLRHHHANSVIRNCWLEVIKYVELFDS